MSSLSYSDYLSYKKAIGYNNEKQKIIGNWSKIFINYSLQSEGLARSFKYDSSIHTTTVGSGVVLVEPNHSRRFNNFRILHHFFSLSKVIPKTIGDTVLKISPVHDTTVKILLRSQSVNQIVRCSKKVSTLIAFSHTLGRMVDGIPSPSCSCWTSTFCTVTQAVVMSRYRRVLLPLVSVRATTSADATADAIDSAGHPRVYYLCSLNRITIDVRSERQR